MFFDQEAGKLYVIPPTEKSLNASRIEVKRLLHGLTGSKVEHVNLKGVNFFGAAMNMKSCKHTTIENCTFRYPVNAQELKETVHADMGVPNQYKQVNNSISGSYNTLRNAYAAYSTGSLLGVSGSHNLVENSIFHDASYDGSLFYKCLSFGGENGGTVRRNTIFNAGNVGIHFGGPNTVIELNHVHNVGLVSHDVSGIYTAGDRAKHCRITRNWVHDIPARIGGNGIRGDDLTRELTINHNVIWNMGEKGIIAKGDFNSVFNNTVFSVRNLGMLLPSRAEPRKDAQVRDGKSFLDIQNSNTLYFNNMVEHETSDKKNSSQPVAVGKQSGNIIIKEDPPLRNVANYDFRPREESRNDLTGSALPDGAVVPVELDPSADQPYTGAYAYQGNNWKPGAIHGIQYQIFGFNGGPDFSLSLKYSLPLIQDDALAVFINGEEVKSGMIRTKNSFRSMTFKIDTGFLQEGKNQIAFASRNFGAIETPLKLTTAINTV